MTGRPNGMAMFEPQVPSFYSAIHLSKISSISLRIFTPHASVFVPSYLQFDGEGSTNVKLVYTNKSEINITLPARISASQSYQKVSLLNKTTNNEDGSSSIAISIKSQNNRLVIPQHEADSGRRTGTKFLSKSENFPFDYKTLQEICSHGGKYIQCAFCSANIINAADIFPWKPLPSETWAEMMDFWHCHKPDENSTLYNKSYAVSKFIPSKNAAFVGQSYLLFNNDNVDALFNGPGSNSNNDNAENNTGTLKADIRFTKIQCPQCKSYLGDQDTETSCKLFKWNLCFQDLPKVPSYFYVSAQIDELVASHGIYSFCFYSEEDDHDPCLFVWVINADVEYTYTGSSLLSKSGTPKGFKVLYSTDSKQIPLIMESREDKGSDTEFITLPTFVINETITHLESGNWILTHGQKTDTFVQDEKNLNVSILEKYQ